MVSEDELFGGSDGSHEAEILGEPTTNDLSTKIKILSDDAMNIYALIISDPRKHGHELNELRRNVVRLAATLLEHNVKIEIPCWPAGTGELDLATPWQPQCKKRRAGPHPVPAQPGAARAPRDRRNLPLRRPECRFRAQGRGFEP